MELRLLSEFVVIGFIRCGTWSRQLHVHSHVDISENLFQATACTALLFSVVFLLYIATLLDSVASDDRNTGEPSVIRDLEGNGGDLIEVYVTVSLRKWTKRDKAPAE